MKNTLFFTLALVLLTVSLFGQSNIWVGSWSCAPYAAEQRNTPPAPFLENNTLRQVIRVSIGGDTLRMKFSNKTCSTPVTMKSVNIAVSAGGSAIDASTITQLKFNGDTTVTMDAYSSAISDPFAFKLDPSARIAITIYYGEAKTSADMTSHVASRTDSYIIEGNQATAADFSGATITAHWFHINTIDVIAPDTAGCVGVLGNSITDGYGLSGGLQNRWTDFFSQKLLDDSRTEQVGVLNLGIGATLVSGSNPTTGVSRYKDDLLKQSGLRWIIIFYGVNDIGGGVPAETIIDAYKTIINDAHARNVKVYGATITPFKGSGYYSEANEQTRQQVNAWIRTPGNFDALIDFDKVIRNPNDTIKMIDEYANDYLHPNADGYEFLGKSVDIDLFTEIENNQSIFADAGADQTVIDFGNDGNETVTLDASLSYNFGSDIESYIWSENETQLATGINPEVNLAIGQHTIALTVTDAEGNSDTDKIIITVVEDKGIWLEAECGKVGSLWSSKTDETASNSTYVTVKAGNNSTDNAASDDTGLITYTFNIEDGGTYNLYARLKCPSANDDSFWVKMDDGDFVMWNGISAPTWQWINFSSGFNLTEGSHTLTISYREDGALMDKLWLSKNKAELTGKGSDANNCNDNTTIDTGYIPNIGIFPNPAFDNITITSNEYINEIHVYDASGKCMIRKAVNTNTKSYNLPITLNSGLFYIKVSSRLGYEMTKFMVQNI